MRPFYILNGNPSPDPPIMERGWAYGDALFESMRMVNGEIVYLEEHLTRLHRGMTFMHYESKIETLREAVRLSLLQTKQTLKNAYLRFTIVRKKGGKYLPTSSDWNYLLSVHPVEDASLQANIKGLQLGIYKDYTVYPAPLSNYKTAQSLPYILGSHWATAHNLDNVLMLNQYGRLAEATNANVFLCIKKNDRNILLTPPLSESCLDGVMRQQLIICSRKWNISVEEIPLEVEQLEEADCVWLTNAIRGIQWVHQIGELSFSPGPIREFVTALSNTD